MTTQPSPLSAADRANECMPPALSDARHVPQGCLISTVAYLARFHALYPAEQAQVLTVELRKFHGMHTIAVLSWRGEWWGRDEFFGVFPLGRRVDRHRDPNQLVRWAEAALDRHADREVRAGRGAWAPPPPRTLSTPERARLVAEAAALLPHPSEVFWVVGPREEIPVLFFRPLPGLNCVYDPLTGTAQAESATTHVPSLVKAFAAHLGYPVVSVHAGAASAFGALLVTTVASAQVMQTR